MLNLTLKKQENNTASITLKENENVYLTAPNYITKDTYSTYVKYFHNLNTSVAKNSIYTLDTPGDYIIFFWKDSDEDVEYRYDLYVRPRSSDPKFTDRIIISPSFSLSSSTNTSELTGSTLDAFTSAISKIHNIINNLGDKSIKASGKLSAEDSKIIAQCDRDVILSGTKQINIKDLNTITLKHDTILDSK